MAKPTVLFLTNSELGQAMVCLAVAHEFLIRSKYAVHVASFSPLEPAIAQLNTRADAAEPPATSTSTLMSAPPPPRWPGRHFRKAPLRSPVKPEIYEDVLCLWDFEKSEHHQPAEAISAIEKLLNLENWPWSDAKDRASNIREKIFNLLHKYLWGLKYHWITRTVIDGKARLAISAQEGVTPAPLPSWLSTPYIVIRGPEDVSYDPETSLARCKNPTVTGGHPILDGDSRHQGSYSALMFTSRSRLDDSNVWLCPTAGHIIDDLETSASCSRTTKGIKSVSRSPRPVSAVTDVLDGLKTRHDHFETIAAFSKSMRVTFTNFKPTFPISIVSVYRQITKKNLTY
ncbi:hypothetical protein BJX68DRAFT_272566 [Aspergillus pseudodeflectus]|uniref:Uncharacterized protein n=1 Tax=Aspergillus pseudodeflectus TaxID=176178 RepID=A0ABR4JEM3_9EURO